MTMLTITPARKKFSKTSGYGDDEDVLKPKLLTVPMYFLDSSMGTKSPGIRRGPELYFG